MGSPCSPALAVLLCSHAEHAFIQNKGTTWFKQKVRAYRYIDDVFMFTNDTSLTFETLQAIYPQPLQLSNENPNDTGEPIPFLSTLNTIRNGKLTVRHHNKSEMRKQKNMPPLKNITPYNSHVPHHIKLATQIMASGLASDNYRKTW